MSMIDSFLNKGFKASKCKTSLKLTIPRIKLLRNRREFQIKQMRKDIAKLLEAGQEATARIRVEHIIREENMMAAQEIIELFCELISVRLPIIESQRECPLDLKEPISSICFAAPRCADLPELLHVQLAFLSKYGKEFVAGASDLMPDCGVNRQLVELLSVRAPSLENKLKLLKEIAEEHEVEWDPAPSETELSKFHEDLLNGPIQFVSGSKTPLPKENNEILQSASVHGTNDNPKSEEVHFDELEFPEVRKVSSRPRVMAEFPTPQPSDPHPEPYNSPVGSDEKPLSESVIDHQESLKSLVSPPSLTPPITTPIKESNHSLGPSVEVEIPAPHPSDSCPEPYISPVESDEKSSNQSVIDHQESLRSSVSTPSSLTPITTPIEESNHSLRPSVGVEIPTPHLSAPHPEPYISPATPVESNEKLFDQSIIDNQESPKSSDNVGLDKQFVPFLSTPSQTPTSTPLREISHSSKPSKSNANVDLNGILAAAKAAAESADRAATAAWAAASLVELRISELSQSRYREAENPSHATEKLKLLDDNPLGDNNVLKRWSTDERLVNNQPENGSKDNRIPTMDDESMLPYPNLFMSQSGNMGSNYHHSENSLLRQGSEMK